MVNYLYHIILEDFIMYFNRKKIIAVLLSCTMLFSVTACNKKRTAKEVLQSSIEQSSNLKGSDFNGNASYTIDTGKGDSQSVFHFKMNFDTKLQSLHSKNLKMSMSSTAIMLGQSVDMDMYYTNGYFYMSSNGQKTKTKMDIKDLQKQIQSTTGQTSLPAKYYKNLKLSEKDGNTVLKYSINSDGLNKYVKDITSQMTTITGGSNSIKISSLTGTKTLNDQDLPVKESIQMVMKSGDNEAGSITLKMTLTYHNPGKSVTVTLPEDLNTYQEVSN